MSAPTAFRREAIRWEEEEVAGEEAVEDDAEEGQDEGGGVMKN